MAGDRTGKGRPLGDDRWSRTISRRWFNQGATRTVRHFPEKLPIGLGSGNDVVFVYVVTDATGREFAPFSTATVGCSKVANDEPATARRAAEEAARRAKALAAAAQRLR